MCKRMKFHCLIVPQTQRNINVCVYLSGCACVCNCGYIILRLNSAVSRATFRDPKFPKPTGPQERPPKTWLPACRHSLVKANTQIFRSGAGHRNLAKA